MEYVNRLGNGEMVYEPSCSYHHQNMDKIHHIHSMPTQEMFFFLELWTKQKFGPFNIEKEKTIVPFFFEKTILFNYELRFDYQFGPGLIHRP